MATKPSKKRVSKKHGFTAVPATLAPMPEPPPDFITVSFGRVFWEVSQEFLQERKKPILERKGVMSHNLVQEEISDNHTTQTRHIRIVPVPCQDIPPEEEEKGDE